MHARLRGSKSLFTFYQILIERDFPFLADEIAEPHQDMNIKVAAFTVSEKSSNTAYETWVKLYRLLILFIVCSFHAGASLILS